MREGGKKRMREGGRGSVELLCAYQPLAPRGLMKGCGENLALPGIQFLSTGAKYALKFTQLYIHVQCLAHNSTMK